MATRKPQPFFAVRIVVTYADGSTVQRDYVRAEYERMGVQKYAEWALGNMLMLAVGSDQEFSYDLYQIDFATVAENRQYHHTTH